jgi:mycothiol synthase
MKPTLRRYRDEDDYWRIREFLREVMLLNGRRELSWHVARLDYWRWHVIETCRVCDPIDRVTFIWEAPDGRIVAVLNLEGRGEAHLQVHPRLRTPDLEEEMLTVAEAPLGEAGPDGPRKLCVWTDHRDELCRSLLARRGYAVDDQPDSKEYQRRQPMSAPIPDAPVAAGYTVRPLGDMAELPARSWASWRAFHPDALNEEYEGWTWYHNIQRQPLHRRDLDIVAVPQEPVVGNFVPTGEIAAFCTAWYDDVTRTAYFEPVGTAPEHQRRGLGKAVTAEALRRLQRMGAEIAFVGGYSPAANALYASAGFVEFDLSEPWVKAW